MQQRTAPVYSKVDQLPAGTFGFVGMVLYARAPTGEVIKIGGTTTASMAQTAGNTGGGRGAGGGSLDLTARGMVTEHLADTTPHAGHVEPPLGSPAGNNYLLEGDVDGTRRWIVAPSTTGDHLVLADDDDTAAGTIFGKLAAGENITLTVVVVDGVRCVQITASGSGGDGFPGTCWQQNAGGDVTATTTIYGNTGLWAMNVATGDVSPLPPAMNGSDVYWARNDDNDLIITTA